VNLLHFVYFGQQGKGNEDGDDNSFLLDADAKDQGGAIGGDAGMILN
jgi:hypothetical protein